MEERLFADDAFFETMQRVKGQLLEGDVAGTLPPQVAEALGLQVARSPRLAGELEAVRERSMASAIPVRAVAWRWTWGLGGGLVAAAAMVVALVAGLRGHSGQAVPQVARVTVPAAAAPVPASVMPATILFLPASVLRGGGGMRTMLAPDISHAAQLQVEVRGDADYDGLSTVLFRDGSEVSGRLVTVRSSEGTVRFLRVIVPAGILSPGQYRLEIGGAGDARSFMREFRLR